jgi:hypothetical protein
MSAIADFCANYVASLPTVKSLDIISPPANQTLVAGGSAVQFVLHATLSNGESRPLKDAVAWSSSAPDVFSIDGSGLAHPLKDGMATITATFGKWSASAMYKVTRGEGRMQSLTLTPQNYTTVGGGDMDFTAAAAFTDGSTVNLPTDRLVWSSSAPKIASIDASGHATFQNAGTATITAKDVKSGIHGCTKITVVAPGAGARKINVQIMLKNFKDEPMSDYYAQGECTSSGAQPVTLWGQEIKGGVMEWPSQLLMPDGIITITLIPRSEADAVPHSVVHYKLPASGIMTLSAVQKAETKRTTAATKDEAIQKVGAQVTAGAPMEVAELGGNEWEITWGTDTLDLKQI